MNPLEQKIGIIGGGQLGKMMILEAKKLNFYISILDPTPDCPAHAIADHHIVADFDDEEAIRQLAEQSDVLTYEFEHIGVDVLIQLEEEGHTVYPTARSLKIIQNKHTQKQTLQGADIAIPVFQYVQAAADIADFAEEHSYPLLLKSCYGGYDGKGNRVVQHADDVNAAYAGLEGDHNELMVEEFIDFKCEISVIAGRDVRGNIVTFPIAENLHQDNILIQTTVPAAITSEEENQAVSVAHEVLQVFDGKGIFCIEMFVTNDGQVLVNEIAPRPHNSGHYTIEGCITSQFEQHIRAIAGLPLGDTSLVKPSVMRNILGNTGPKPARYKGILEAMEIAGVNPHIYGKTEVRPGRKMGHITTIGNNLTDIKEKCQKASELIQFEES